MLNQTYKDFEDIAIKYGLIKKGNDYIIDRNINITFTFEKDDNFGYIVKVTGIIPLELADYIYENGSK